MSDYIYSYAAASKAIDKTYTAPSDGWACVHIYKSDSFGGQSYIDVDGARYHNLNGNGGASVLVKVSAGTQIRVYVPLLATTASTWQGGSGAAGCVFFTL